LTERLFFAPTQQREAIDRHPADPKNTHTSEAPNPGDIIS